jgi:hypothetical protein
MTIDIASALATVAGALALLAWCAVFAVALALPDDTREDD